MAEFLSPPQTRKFKDKRERHQHITFINTERWKTSERKERIFFVFFVVFSRDELDDARILVSRISFAPSLVNNSTPANGRRETCGWKTGNPAQPLSDLLCHHHCPPPGTVFVIFIFFTSLRSFSTASRFIALKGETIKSRGPTKSWTARGRNHSPFFCCFVFCFKCYGSSLPKDRRRRRKTAGLFRVSSVGRPPPQRAVALYSVAV